MFAADVVMEEEKMEAVEFIAPRPKPKKKSYISNVQTRKQIQSNNREFIEVEKTWLDQGTTSDLL